MAELGAQRQRGIRRRAGCRDGRRRARRRHRSAARRFEVGGRVAGEEAGEQVAAADVAVPATQPVQAGFLSHLTHAGGWKVNRPAGPKRNLIYVIIAEATNMEPTAMSDPLAVDDHLRDRRLPRGPWAREAEAPEVIAAAGADHLGPTRRGAREHGASGGGEAGM